MVSHGTTAVALAAVGWEPDGPLPRRLEPLDMRSIPSSGPSVDHVAASVARTLPGGAVCLRSPPDPSSGEYVAVRVDGETQSSLKLGPARAHVPGWRVVDAVGGSDGSWTLLELVPGPPDQVLVRRVGPDGDTLWQSSATAGAPDSLRSLLADGAGNVFGVTAGAPPRLVRIDAEGEISDLLELAGAPGAVFMDGRGRIGFVADAEDEARYWVTIDPRTRDSRELSVDWGSQWELDLPLGMGSEGRPYANRYGTIVRLGPDGHVDWELPVQDLVVAGRAVWAASPTQDGTALEVLTLAGDAVGAIRTLTPPAEDPPRRWRLTGHVPPDSFVLYRGGEGARTLVTGAAEDPDKNAAAPADVWLHAFELQVPTGPSVTDAGEIDLVTRGPEALYVVRVTPGGQ